MKMFRSGEKGFEEEKIKVFTKPKTKKTKNKEEQLDRAFNALLSSMLLEYEKNNFCQPVSSEPLIEKYVRIFLREVKIRVYLGG